MDGNGWYRFTPRLASVCAELGAEYRHTSPRSPQTNGMVEHFNGRVGSEVLGIAIHFYAELEQMLRCFDAAYDVRRQRGFEGKTPGQVIAERLIARRKLGRGKTEGRAEPDDAGFDGNVTLTTSCREVRWLS